MVKHMPEASKNGCLLEKKTVFLQEELPSTALYKENTSFDMIKTGPFLSVR